MSEFEKYRYKNLLPRHVQIKRLIWGAVWAILFRPTPRWAMHAWRRGLLRVFGAKIGTGSKIAPSCFVWAPWNLEMGDFSALGDNVDCYTMDKITIGSKVAVSQRSFLCTGTHDISSLHRPLKTAPVAIGNHAWICAEAFVGPGVTLGDGAVAGARAVVVHDVTPWTIVAGNPARVIKMRQIPTE